MVGRLAPTPSGHLHLGNVLAFGAAWLSARSAGGRLLLRIEDVDQGRARVDIEQAIRGDLRWLGLTWDHETDPQRERDYQPWLDVLADHVYRCVCTRRQIREAGGRYPGTCRLAGHPEGAVRFRVPDTPVVVVDRRLGPQPPVSHPDVVLQRRDGAFAYNLAVVADDIADGVTEVVRGADLLETTAAQVPIWHALGATPPTWLHVPLVVGGDGKKLSKSHRSTELRALRAAGWSPERVWRHVLPWLGLDGIGRLDDAVSAYSPAARADLREVTSR